MGIGGEGLQFIMNGTVIHTATQFNENFSPTEIIFKRETAARFMLNILAPLSAENLFNSAVFAVYTFDPPEGGINGEGYRHIGAAREAVKGRYDHVADPDLRSERIIYDTQYIENYFSKPYVCDLLKEVRGVADEASLEESEKNQLFALLASAYLIAGKRFFECPVTPKTAKDAFKRVSYEKTEVTRKEKPEDVKPSLKEEKTAKAYEDTALTDDTFTSFDKAENFLKCRSVAYKVKCRASKPLIDGEIIEPRKITAQRSALGLDGDVKLHVYDGEGKEMLMQTEIRSGEYIFGNFVGDELVLLHPVSRASDSCAVTREGEHIRLYDKENGTEKSFMRCRDIVSLIPENHQCGFIGINTYGAFYDGYSEILPDTVIEKDIVQAEIFDERIYLLHKEGYVYVNMRVDRSTDTRYADLGEYLKERG